MRTKILMTLVLIALMNGCVRQGAAVPAVTAAKETVEPAEEIIVTPSLGYSAATYVVHNPIALNTPSVISPSTATGYVIAPALPAGLSFNTTTGVISGTPRVVGTTAHTVTVTLADSSTLDASVPVTITRELATDLFGTYTSSNDFGYTRWVEAGSSPLGVLGLSSGQLRWTDTDGVYSSDKRINFAHQIASTFYVELDVIFNSTVPSSSGISWIVAIDSADLAGPNSGNWIAFQAHRDVTGGLSFTPWICNAACVTSAPCTPANGPFVSSIAGDSASLSITRTATAYEFRYKVGPSWVFLAGYNVGASTCLVNQPTYHAIRFLDSTAASIDVSIDNFRTYSSAINYTF